MPEKQRLVRQKTMVMGSNISGRTKIELTAYYSVTNKEPSKENNMKVSESP